MRKYTEKSNELDLQLKFINAKRVINSFNFELPDQQFMLENFLQAIQKSKLKPHSFQFDRISTIARNAFNTNCSKKRYKGTEYFTAKESVEYKKLPQCEEISKVLLGQNILGSTKETSVDQYLKIQAEILKGMTYSQFVDSMNPSNK